MTVGRRATQERSPIAVTLTAVLLTAGQLIARVPLLSSRRFDPDELEHMHVAWSIAHGQVPFRDFFEHHTPLFHYLLAFAVSIVGPERSADRAMAMLVGARYAMWLVSVAIVVLTFLLARRLRDETTAWVALPLISGSIVMALRAVEIRPDGLATALWLAALIAFHAGLTSADAKAFSTQRRFAAAGLLIGLGVLTSQKLLFAGPPMGIAIGWYLLSARFAGATRERVINALWLTAGVVLTWSIMLVYFSSQQAAMPFLKRTLLEAAGWKAETTAATVLTFLMRYEPWLFALTACGALVLVRQCVKRRPAVGNVLLLVFAAGLFLGLFVMPVPFPQYYLTFLPLFAIISASGVIEVARDLAAAKAHWSVLLPSANGALFLLVVGGLTMIGLMVAKPVIVSPLVYPAVVVAAVVALFALPWHRRSTLALVVVLIALSVFPAQWVRWMHDLGDGGQFKAIRYVIEHTAVDDVVLDGWSGYGVFRPHANYYWMLHPGVRAMLPPDVVPRLLRDLDEGHVVPHIIVLDPNLQALSSDLVRFVGSRYAATGIGDIYLRK